MNDRIDLNPGAAAPQHHGTTDVWNWILRHIRTLDATGGIKPFPNFPFAAKLVQHICDNRVLLIAKSRQMMATWTVAAVMLHRAIYDPPGVYLLMSKGQRETLELIKRLKIVLINLPEELREQIKPQKEEVLFNSGSRLVALPASDFAARMFSPAGVFWDEMAFTPHADEIWGSIKPAVDSGGSFVGVSTPNGMDNQFYTLFNDATNGFKKLEIHWQEHPERDADWEQEARMGLSEARWKQEYEVNFDTLSNRVFDEFDAEVHILAGEFKWNPEAGRTYRSIDFGYRHPYVIWAQVTPDGSMTVFDEWEGGDHTVENMLQNIHKIDARHGIKEADVAFTACDPAGDSLSDQGISSVKYLKDKGLNIVYRRSEIMTGVERVKSLLKDAAGTIRLRFTTNAERLVYHLQHYRWKRNLDKPDKDNIHDHAVDALRYLCINIQGQEPPAWTGAMVKGGRW